MHDARCLAVTVVTLGCWLIGASASAEPIDTGRRMVDVRGLRMEVFTYRPQCAQPSLLMMFHGAQRDAEDYRDYARPIADRLCMLVLAPRFDRKRFPSWRYQRGGIVDIILEAEILRLAEFLLPAAGAALVVAQRGNAARDQRVR